MNDALIGHTGFVGQTLAGQRAFAARFNSRTIAEAAGRRFDTVFCAAAPGSMFEANRFPDRDAARMEALMESIGRIGAERFVLISSIAVLERFDGGDDETTTRLQTELAYGRNRARLEAFCAQHYPRCLVVRLPALFGPGLKKNFLFDILNPMPTMLPPARLQAFAEALPAPLAAGLSAIYREDAETGMAVVDRAALEASGKRADYDEAAGATGFSALGFTSPETRFQYYDMSALSADIDRGLDHGLPLLHLAPEPVEAGLVHQTATGRPMEPNGARIHREDMRTAHAGLWGRTGPYIADAAEVLAALARFFAQETKAAA